MIILFQTDLVQVIVNGSMLHLHSLGQRLHEISQLSDDVQEYLDEFVEGWSDYLVRLEKYLDKMRGVLVEDPRSI